ncbi:MAG: TetR/AcrR family transcriptional regulator [Alphaproteobacteria bacterium]
MAQNKRGNQTKLKKKKPDKKAAPKRDDLRPAIVRAAMTVAGRDGWSAATLSNIAREAQLKPAEIELLYADIWEILADALDDIEDRTEAEVKDYLGDSWRDNLLEILMARFDFAQDFRPALIALPAFAARHPRHSRRFAPRLYDTMERMLYLARLPQERISPLAIAAFALIYLSLVERWSKDETADLSPTMAAIDKRLGWFEQALGYIDKAPIQPARKAAKKVKAKVKKIKNKLKTAT